MTLGSMLASAFFLSYSGRRVKLTDLSFATASSAPSHEFPVDRLPGPWFDEAAVPLS
jgi:hypothetical protein